MLFVEEDEEELVVRLNDDTAYALEYSRLYTMLSLCVGEVLQ